LDSNFGAGDGTAAKQAETAGFVGHDTVTGGVDREVAANFGADAWPLGHTDLADNNLAGFDLFAAKQFDAEALARTIMDVFGCTAGFDMRHIISL
jgi:hypothetical protein